MRLWRTALVGALGSVLMFGSVIAPASAVGPERDPERYSPTGTAWGYLVTDKASIDTWLNQYAGRAIDVEPWGSGWSVVAVDNKNPAFTRSPGGSFSWTTDETQASLTSKINQGRRLLDLERHTVNGSTRFAATWVDNTGVAAKSWWWWLDQTPAQIVTRLNGCGCRLIDIDPLGNGRYDVIMIPNTGVDALSWWWYTGSTASQIADHLRDNQARPVDLEPDGTGRFAVLMVRDGLTGGFATGRSWAQLTSGPPPGTRYIHVKSYGSVWLAVHMQN